MSPTTLVLLVIVWPGHDLQRMPVDQTECRQAQEAIHTAASISEKYYGVQSNALAYCIPLNTPADPIVQALLDRPTPSSVSKPSAMQKLEPAK